MIVGVIAILLPAAIQISHNLASKNTLSATGINGELGGVLPL